MSVGHRRGLSEMPLRRDVLVWAMLTSSLVIAIALFAAFGESGLRRLEVARLIRHSERLIEKDRFDEAVELLERSVRLQPESSEARAMLVETLLRSGRIGEAQEWSGGCRQDWGRCE